MATQVWLGRFAVGTGMQIFAIDEDGAAPSESFTVPAAKYFMAGYTSESADQLVEAITQEFVDGTNYTDYTCTFDYTTGKVTITSPDADFTITWTDTDLRDALGYTGATTSSSSYAAIAPNEAKYCWRPNRSLSHHPVEIGRVFAPMTTTVVQAAKDGTTTGVTGQLLYKARLLEYQKLAEARVMIPSTGSINQELEQFYADVLHSGEHVRLFTDDTATTSSDYVTLAIVDEDGQIPEWDDLATRTVRRSNTLWDVAIPAKKVV
jgi:hypothetical protein